MTCAIDTNVITALWNADDALNRVAQAALDKVFGQDNLLISGVVYAELLAAPGRTELFIDRFCEEAGIGVDWEVGKEIFRLAGAAFKGYAERRRRQKGPKPRRILADFLIGAHAAVNGYKLLTMDEGVYRVAFPRLRIVQV